MKYADGVHILRDTDRNTRLITLRISDTLDKQRDGDKEKMDNIIAGMVAARKELWGDS